jgi:hypothetical protein
MQNQLENINSCLGFGFINWKKGVKSETDREIIEF